MEPLSPGLFNYNLDQNVFKDKLSRAITKILIFE